MNISATVPAGRRKLVKIGATMIIQMVRLKTVMAATTGLRHRTAMVVMMARRKVRRRMMRHRCNNKFLFV